MKKCILNLSVIGALIFGIITSANLKTEMLVKEASNFNDVVLMSNKTKLTAERVKQIVVARVPGSSFSNITEFRSEGEVFKGTLTYNNKKYQFEIDAYTGRAIKWNVV